MSLYQIINKFEGLQNTGHDKWVARCPAHPDKNPSLSITVSDNGNGEKVLLHCHAGCEFAEILKAAGLSAHALFLTPRKETPHEAEALDRTFKRLEREAGNSNRAVAFDTSPLPVVSEVLPPEALSPEAYHGIAGEIVRIVEPHTESDPAALLLGFLTVFGNMIGSDAHFEVEADRHPCRSFVVLVGDTAKGRKGTAQGWILKIFSAVDDVEYPLNIAHGLSTGEGLTYHVRDAVFKNNEIIDTGVQDKRLLIIEPEFAQSLKVTSREGNTLSPFLRQAWDSGNLRMLTKNNPTKATNAHISVIGHITKEELLKSMREVEAFNGFANRFLWIHVKRSKQLPFGGNLNDSELTPLIEKLKDVVQWSKRMERVTWHDASRPIWQQVYSELSRERHGVQGVILSRAEAQVTRIALTYALLDKSTTIKPTHLYAALAVWEYVEQSVSYIFQDKTGNRNADRIFEALTLNGELTKTEIYRDVFQKHREASEIDVALDVLQSQNLVEIQQIPTEGRTKTIVKLAKGGLNTLNTLNT